MMKFDYHHEEKNLESYKKTDISLEVGSDSEAKFGLRTKAATALNVLRIIAAIVKIIGAILSIIQNGSICNLYRKRFI